MSKAILLITWTLYSRTSGNIFSRYAFSGILTCPTNSLNFSSMSANRKIVFDCDTGVDDAQAIILTLAQPAVDIVAITTVNGNVDALQAAKNTMRILHHAKRTDIPVYAGCTKPILSIPAMETKFSDPAQYHGNDGLGDVPNATTGSPPHHLIRSEKAPVALVDLINKYPGEIELICLGPLTNLAVAMKIDEALTLKLKSLHIMGGAIYSKGNVTVTGEYNFIKDAEAAAIVMEETQCPTVVVSWETCCEGGLPWSWFDEWVSQEQPMMKFMKQFTAHTIQLDKSVWATDYCPPDVVTTAIALRPDMMTEKAKYHCIVDTGRNPITRGMLTVDWKHLLKQTPNITLCLKWNEQVFKELLENIPKTFKSHEAA